MKTDAMHEISCYIIICKGGQILLLRFKAMPKFRIQKTSLDKILSTTFRVFKGSSVPKPHANRYQCHYLWKTKYKRWDKDNKEWRFFISCYLVQDWVCQIQLQATLVYIDFFLH